MANRDWKKGIWYAALPGETVTEKFAAAKAAGFNGVEPQSDLPEEEVLRARDDTGVAVPSVACGQHSRALSSPNRAMREAGVEGLKDALRKAHRYGAASILVVPGDVNETIAYDEAWVRVQSELRKVLPLAEKLGVKLAFENVWNHFLLSPIEAVRFVDEFRSPAVGWQFDVGNVVHLGWPEHWIRALGNRILKVHLKEFSRKNMNERGLRAGFAVEFLEGDCDWPSVMKALDEIGYRGGWVIVEPAWRPNNVEPALRLRQIAQKTDQILAL